MLRPSLQAEDGAQGRVDLDHADRGKLSGGDDEAGAGVAEPRRIERPNLEAEEGRVLRKAGLAGRHPDVCGVVAGNVGGVRARHDGDDQSRRSSAT